MLNQFTTWFSELVKGWFIALWDFVVDGVIYVFTLLLTAIGSLIASIPVPDWMAGGLGSLWGTLPAGMVYLLSAAGVPQALSLIGAGFAFRLLRKIFTLFQW